MIRIENLNKSFGSRVLFNSVDFKINQKERIGLVGRNGHGKTTLLRIIAGKEQYEKGVVAIPGNYKIGYVLQQPKFCRGSILEECMTGLPGHERDSVWKAEKILSGLGFSSEDMKKPPDKFSGGYQVRLSLAKTLVSEPDLLLLDEPTNYLDITSIRWVESFLKKWPRELVLISHNRSFMDHVITHVVGIHRKKIRKVAGNTEKYYTQIAQDEEVYEKTRINDEKRRREIKKFVTRFRAKARLANLVQSRIKTLSKLEKKEKLESINNFEFSFINKPFHGKFLMSASNLSFSYDKNNDLIRDLDLSIGVRERLCIIGKNGKGKSTLLKLLAGALEPDQGEVVCHKAVSKGFFEQTNVKSLYDNNTVEQEIMLSNPEIDRQSVRNICGAMMFSGDDALKKIGVLSGGEKTRVMLGKIIAEPVNLLLLDEPTNHLDMEACDSLLAAIDGFEGAVIMVTHNEMFLHAIAEKLVVFQNDRIKVFTGSYRDFLETEGWEEEKTSFNNRSEEIKQTKKEIRKKRSEHIVKRSKILTPLKKKMQKLEYEIEASEKILENLNNDIIEATRKKDGRKISLLSQSIHGCRLKVDSLYDELEKVSDDFDDLKNKFNNIEKL